MQHTKQRTFKNLGTEGRRRRKNNKFLSHSAIFLAHYEICIQEISLSCEPQNLKKKRNKERQHQNHLLIATITFTQEYEK